MASPLKQLPWELEEEILSRLPLQALLRFRTVYSIDIISPNSIDPTIDLCGIPSSDSPYGGDRILDFATLTTCDEFLLCFDNWFWEEKTALWNPWLRQVTWIEQKDNTFYVVGLGYDNSRPDKVYKMLVWYFGHTDVQGLHHERVAVYECASHAFKSIDTPDDDWLLSTASARGSYVPLNGNLYWVAYNVKTCEYFIQNFDFSRENYKPLCLLPCQRSHRLDRLLLEVFEGDRFSVLKICHKTRNMGIWVTKKRISYNNGDDGEGVVWINFMTLSAINLPTLLNFFRRRISYFIYNKTIFMCSGDGETGMACIYVVNEDLCKKIEIGSPIFDFRHCVYTPNLISLPSFT